MGGMGIYKPAEECLISNINSEYISAPLVRLIQRQTFDFEPRELADQMEVLRAEVDKESDTRSKSKLEAILLAAPPELKQAVKAASEKGASSWVTASPSYDHGTVRVSSSMPATFAMAGRFWTSSHLCVWNSIQSATCVGLPAWKLVHYSAQRGARYDSAVHA